MKDDLNMLQLATLFKLESLLAAVAAGSAFADLIEYSDNQIEFTINHQHNKLEIIRLIESLIRNIHTFELIVISPGAHIEHRLDESDNYLFILDIKEEVK